MILRHIGDTAAPEAAPSQQKRNAPMAEVQILLSAPFAARQRTGQALETAAARRAGDAHNIQTSFIGPRPVGQLL